MFTTGNGNIDKFIKEISGGSIGGYPKRLFIVSDNHIIYTISNKTNKHSTLTMMQKDSIVFGSFKIDRGRILETFSKFEFLVSQIILAILNPNIDINFRDVKLMNTWNDLLDQITFQAKIKIIEKTTDVKFGKLTNLIGIRNHLAHSIDLNYIEYNNINLKKNLKEFEGDILSEWEKLLEIYTNIWDQDKLVSIIQDKIQIFQNDIVE